jgi:predicted permease
MNMSAILTQMAVLFIVMAAGYAAGKLKFLTGDSNKLLSRLVIHIAMPCTILNSVLSGEITASGRDAAVFMLMASLSFAVFFVPAILLPIALRTDKRERGILRFMVVFGNVGFMGFPVIQSIFGTGALFYVTIFNVVFNILAFSIGILMVSGRGGKINPRLFLSPTMIASVLTVAVFYLKPAVPAIVTDAVALIGQLTTPSAMLVLGSTLATISLREVFGDARIYPLAAVKLLCRNGSEWLVMRLFITAR